MWYTSVKGDPDGVGTIKWREYAADIVHATWDPVRNIYVAYVKSWTWPRRPMNSVTSPPQATGWAGV